MFERSIYPLMSSGMKKFLLLLCMCAVFASCKDDPENYGTLIVGAWEAKNPQIEISGAPNDVYKLLKEEMNDRFDHAGGVFEFKVDNTVSGPGGNGVYKISDHRLQITHEGSGETPFNFTIVSLNNRSIMLTYNALEEQPALSILYPELTKCLVTITASKTRVKNNK